MAGKKSGFVGNLIKNNINVKTFHCVIHQENLAAKCLNSDETLKVVVNIINKIRGGHNALTHRKFKQFLLECEADYRDLVMYQR